MLNRKLFMVLAAAGVLALTTGCDEEDCEVDTDCRSDQICVDGSCVIDNGGGTCIDDSECGAYTCLNSGICGSDCIDNLDCNTGFECNDTGACVPEGGGGGETYDRVLLISRTTGNIGSDTNGDAREPNPGPDIDAVSVTPFGSSTEAFATTATGDHGHYAGSTAVTFWASPSEATGANDSIPPTIPGQCILSSTANQTSPYFFMGTGQAQAVTTISHNASADTRLNPVTTAPTRLGHLVLGFGQAIEDGDVIKVYEVNGSDGDVETCTNIPTARPNDDYGVYLVRSDATVGDGTSLTAPQIVYLGDGLGVASFTVTLD